MLGNQVQTLIRFMRRSKQTEGEGSEKQDRISLHSPFEHEVDPVPDDQCPDHLGPDPAVDEEAEREVDEEGCSDVPHGGHEVQVTLQAIERRLDVLDERHLSGLQKIHDCEI